MAELLWKSDGEMFVKHASGFSSPIKLENLIAVGDDFILLSSDDRENRHDGHQYWKAAQGRALEMAEKYQTDYVLLKDKVQLQRALSDEGPRCVYAATFYNNRKRYC